jgi:hypothetical protein
MHHRFAVIDNAMALPHLFSPVEFPLLTDTSEHKGSDFLFFVYLQIRNNKNRKIS